uniref:Uncharacterized protein n=1 Tax=Candidatus Kentrum sp. DK TaxID=2126562 RepID=A0A450TFT8_9GAMM|nr:MAG: hypothetical protein BECKDK2373C_GA0170839_11394 [Candidatus Kentron sp. DK]
MNNHNPFIKTIHRGLLTTFCLTILISSPILGEERTAGRKIIASEWKPPTNTACDGYRNHPNQTKNKDVILYPEDGSACVMREYFSDEESALNAKHRIRKRFIEMASSHAGSVIGTWEKYKRQAGTIEVLQAIMIKAMIGDIKDDLPIVDRNAVCVPSGNNCAPSEKSWWIEVEAKAVIPRLSLEKAVDDLYERVTNNEEEKRKLMEEVTELKGFSRKKQEKIEQLENEKEALSAENKRLLTELKRERRVAEEKSRESYNWRDLHREIQRSKTRGLAPTEEIKQRIKDSCESKSSLVQEKCRRYQTEKAAEEKNVAIFVENAEKLGSKLDPWNRHLLGIAYWRYYYDDKKFEQAGKEMTRALEKARRDSDFDKDKLRKMHYNLALFHAAQGRADLGLEVLEGLKETQLDKEGRVLRAVLRSRIAQRDVCKDLRTACGKEQIASPSCAGWRIARERGDCRKDDKDDKDAGATSGIGLGPDGWFSPLTVTFSDPFSPSD